MSEYISLFILHDDEVVIDDYRHLWEEHERKLEKYFREHVVYDPIAELKKLIDDLVSRACRHHIDEVISKACRMSLRAPRALRRPQNDRLRHQVSDRRIAIAPKARSAC